jgi:F-type H+-transporting ATPase subunit gamma
MEDTRKIRRRMTSIRNTRQITAAMETVAAAKLRKAKARTEDARPYVRHLQEAIQRILQNVPGLQHPLITVPDGEAGPVKRGYLVITSDRGLNGGYNSTLTRKCLQAIEGEVQPSVVVVGRKGRDFFRGRGMEIRGEYVGLSDYPAWETAVQIGDQVRQFYLDGVYDELYLAYNEFITALHHAPLLKLLLPVQAVGEREPKVPPPSEGASEVAQTPPVHEGEAYQFEPGASQALGALLPHYINSLVFGALLEAKAAEHGARMTAMGMATGNAGEILKKLALRFNRARQGAITAEILEVVSGGIDSA